MSIDKQRKVGIVVLIVSTLAMIVSAVNTVRSSTYYHCQQRVNDALIRSQNARAEAAEQDRQAVDQMVASFLAIKPGNPGAGRTVLENYLKQRQEADKQRAAHPLPPPESC